MSDNKDKQPLPNRDYENDLLYNEDPNRSPCSYKSVCKGCKKTHIADRPALCAQLECIDYLPCPQCHNNKPLDEIQRICADCIKDNNRKKAPSLSPSDTKVFRGRKQFPGFMSSETAASAATAISNAGLPTPAEAGEFDDLGIAPAALTEKEKAYFETRWQEYDGYYRDPSAYFIVHSMIIAEIGVRRTETQVLTTQYEAQAGKIAEKQQWLSYIALLKKQLPEKEAMRESDAETSLNHIYTKYLEAKHVRNNGRVSRIFSPEAVAIAPCLLYKADLRRILQRMNYEVVDIDAALALLPEFGATPGDALKAFGFFLDEKYAMPYKADDEYGDAVIDDESIQYEEPEEDGVDSAATS